LSPLPPPALSSGCCSENREEVKKGRFARRTRGAQRACEPTAMSDWSDEETDDPHYADRRNFYKVEKWSRDGLRV